MESLNPPYDECSREKVSLELEDYYALLLQKVFIRLQQVCVDRQAYINSTSFASLGPWLQYFCVNQNYTLFPGMHKLTEPLKKHRPLKGQHITCFKITIFLGFYEV